MSIGSVSFEPKATALSPSFMEVSWAGGARDLRSMSSRPRSATMPGSDGGGCTMGDLVTIEISTAASPTCA